MNNLSEKCRKRVNGAMLSQYQGKAVCVLGEFIQMEPNGRVFKLRASDNQLITVQLQEPALKVSPEDCELFQFEADPEKQNFFLSHLDTFKRMWSEQGSTYWLRFLLSFRSYFLNYNEYKLEHINPMCYNESGKILETGFIYIHKNFIEGDHSAARNLINNMFTIAKSSHLIPEVLSSSIVRDPFYSKSSRDAFRALFGTPNSDKKSTVVMVFIIFPMYTRFCGAVCTLLKRWAAENDLIFENSDVADNKYIYWMPFQEWTDDRYAPSLFESYIGNYWKDKLPKMLMTCDIHNIFITKSAHNCCIKTDNETVEIKTTYTKKKSRFKSFYKHRYDVSSCKTHSNCRRKIQHTVQCLEPYFCEGGPNCSITCEMLLKNNNKIDKGMEDKRFGISVFKNKQKNKRNVSTAIETKDNVFLETFLPDKKGKKSSLGIHLEINHIEKNEFKQNQSVEDVKERLRNKLSKKNKELFELDWNRVRNDSEAFKDQKYRLVLVEKATKKFQKEMISQIMCEKYELNFSNRFYQYGSKYHYSSSCDLESEKLEDIFQVMNSVAVGTDDLVWGKVYIVSKKPLEKDNETDKANGGKDNDVNKDVSVQTPPLGLDEIMNMGIVVDNDKSVDKRKVVSIKSNEKPVQEFSVKNKDEDAHSRSDISENKVKQKNSEDLRQNNKKVDLTKNDAVKSNEIKVAYLDKENSKPKPEISAKINLDSNKSKEVDDAEDESIKKGAFVSSKKKKKSKKKKLVDAQKLPHLETGTVTKNMSDNKDASDVEISKEKTKKKLDEKEAKEKISAVKKETSVSEKKVIAEGIHLFSNSKDDDNASEFTLDMAASASKNIKQGVRKCLVSLSNQASGSVDPMSGNVRDFEKHVLEMKNTVNHMLSRLLNAKYQDNVSSSIVHASETVAEGLFDLQAAISDINVIIEKSSDCLTKRKKENASNPDKLVTQSLLEFEASICEIKSTMEEISDKLLIVKNETSNNISSAHKNNVEAPVNKEKSIEKEFLDNFVEVKEEDKIDTELSGAIKSVSKNLDKIEHSIKENNGSLGYEEFLLMLETGNMLVGATADDSKIEPKSKENNNGDTNLKICAFCHKKETQRKSFKKCSRCKAENFPQQRYYCSRECQVNDWNESHRIEHLNNI